MNRDWKDEKLNWIQGEQRVYVRLQEHKPPSVWRDVRDVLGWAVLAGLGYVLVVMGLAS